MVITIHEIRSRQQDRKRSGPFRRQGQPILISVFCLILCLSASAAELERLTNVTLINGAGNDGDSFQVDANGKRLWLRLYFVDCPEMHARTEIDMRRLREQTRYFGLVDADTGIAHGEKARAMTERLLAVPFTVHTSYASAMGRSSKKRNYAFVTTADGVDLGTALVAAGLARAKGVGRKTPSGVSPR